MARGKEEGDADVLTQLRRHFPESSVDAEISQTQNLSSRTTHLETASPAILHHLEQRYAAQTEGFGMIPERQASRYRYDTAFQVLRQLAEGIPGMASDPASNISGLAYHDPANAMYPTSGFSTHGSCGTPEPVASCDHFPSNILDPYRPLPILQPDDGHHNNTPPLLHGTDPSNLYSRSMQPTVLSLGNFRHSDLHIRPPVYRPTSGVSSNMRSIVNMASPVQTGAMHISPSVAAVLQSSGESIACNGAACTVLAAKKLTASDIKNSRAILPRLAIENNMPFVMAYRAYGLCLPDDRGAEWDVVIKSWANGRSEFAPPHQKRRLDRRVFVLEGIAPFLAAHCLTVGSVFGIVVENGALSSASQLRFCDCCDPS
jgi:hypothetical protein